MLCEYSREELNEYRKNRKVPGESREEMEEAINREIERGERKLIKRYEGYLEIREEVNDPIEEYKDQLRDQENDEDELDELVDMHFGKVQCKPCEDENQPNSTDDEPCETQNNFTRGRTWVVEPVKLHKPKPRKRRRVKKGERNNGVDRSYPRSTCGNEGKPKRGYKHRKTR
jgi:hypothetical protein